MELETIFGLPAHPLLVHLAVVLVPLAALIAVVFAFRPAWLDRFGWGLVALSGAGAFGAVLAAGSGEGLESLQNDVETAAREDHFEMGEMARNLSLLFFFLVTAVVVLRYLARRRAAAGQAPTGFWGLMAGKAGAIGIAAALVLTASGALVTVAVAGHQGAKLAWCEETKNCPADNGGGEGTEQGDDDGDDDGD
ncbi:MAG: hypothetical protein Q7V88_08225 [Actinomycetota bacterium]|nr:hypothetical protein [Actinomycetota bacterium]